MVVKYFVWFQLLFKRPMEAWYHVYAKFCRWRWRSSGFNRVGEYNLYLTSVEEALKEITQQPSTLIRSVRRRSRTSRNTNLPPGRSGKLPDPTVLTLRKYTRSVMERTQRPNDIYEGPIPHSFNASMELGRLCYAICRLVKPSKVVETGVANGLTSFSILQALKENGSGQLYSVELPPLRRGAESWIGHLVPEFLRSAWRLLLGPSQFVLPKILPQLGPIDIFVHDSDHSYWNQLAEFRLIWPHLRSGGIVISDDVMNDALLEVAEEQGATPIIVAQSRPGFIGILVKP